VKNITHFSRYHLKIFLGEKENEHTILKTLLIVWAQAGFLFPTSKSNRTERIFCWIFSSPRAV